MVSIGTTLHQAGWVRPEEFSPWLVSPPLWQGCQCCSFSFTFVVVVVVVAAVVEGAVFIVIFVQPKNSRPGLSHHHCGKVVINVIAFNKSCYACLLLLLLCSTNRFLAFVVHCCGQVFIYVVGVIAVNGLYGLF